MLAWWRRRAAHNPHLPSDDCHQAPAELAPNVATATPAVHEYHTPFAEGYDTGPDFGTPTGVVGSPPPAPAEAPMPQRVATHPAFRRAALVRDWPLYPLNRGNHLDIPHDLDRSTAVQNGVELRGSASRVPPDNTDPNWSEVAG